PGESRDPVLSSLTPAFPDERPSHDPPSSSPKAGDAPALAPQLSPASRCPPDSPPRRPPMTPALLLPRQGSQSVGMGAALADAFASAREVYAEIDDALGQKLGQLMREGPEDQLTLTENAQPALMAVSVAAARVLRTEFDVDVTRAAFVACHSLREYSALCAAGALSLSDTARLLKLRGQAMQRAVPVGRGAMASLIGPKTDLALAEAAAAAGSEVGVCVV